MKQKRDGKFGRITMGFTAEVTRLFLLFLLQDATAYHGQGGHNGSLGLLSHRDGGQTRQRNELQGQRNRRKRKVLGKELTLKKENRQKDKKVKFHTES